MRRQKRLMDHGRRLRILLVLAAGLAPVAAAPAAAAPAAAASDACRRDAVVLLSEVRRARADLMDAATGSQKERCAAWREQVRVLQRAAAFYRRCQKGAGRDRNVANAMAGVAQYRDAVRAQCGGG